jgi:hypothetical protein
MNCGPAVFFILPLFPRLYLSFSVYPAALSAAALLLSFSDRLFRQPSCRFLSLAALSAAVLRLLPLSASHPAYAFFYSAGALLPLPG